MINRLIYWLRVAWVYIRYGYPLAWERFNQWCDEMGAWMDRHIAARLIAFYLMVLFWLWIFGMIADVTHGNEQKAMHVFMVAFAIIAAGLSLHDVIDTYRKRETEDDGTMD